MKDLQSDKVIFRTALKLVGLYVSKTQKYCDATFKFSKNSNIDKHERFRDFLILSDILIGAGVDPKLYVSVVFEGADFYLRPSIDDLLRTELHLKRVFFRLRNRQVRERVKAQKKLLNFFVESTGLDAHKVVLLRSDFFDPWFRLLFLRKPPKKVRTAALEEVKNPYLYNAIVKEGYDIKEITKWSLDDSE